MKPPAGGQSRPSGSGSVWPLVDRDELGMAAAPEQRTDPRARTDDLADALEPGDVDRRARRRRIVAGALHQIGPVDPRRVDTYQHLAVARNRVWPLLELEPAVLDDRRTHPA
jgi:hypothetical protein